MNQWWSYQHVGMGMEDFLGYRADTNEPCVAGGCEWPSNDDSNLRYTPTVWIISADFMD